LVELGLVHSHSKQAVDEAHSSFSESIFLNWVSYIPIG
jgi:hypothetical protein